MEDNAEHLAGRIDEILAHTGADKVNIIGNGRRGISHADEVDMRRRPLCGKNGDGISDITAFYKEIALDLMKRGY